MLLFQRPSGAAGPEGAERRAGSAENPTAEGVSGRDRLTQSDEGLELSATHAQDLASTSSIRAGLGTARHCRSSGWAAARLWRDRR